MKRKLALAALMLAAGLAMAGCGKEKTASTETTAETNKTQSAESLVGIGADRSSATEAAPAENTDETTEDGMVYSYLSGKLVPAEIGRKRPIAFMFNNIIDAVPQWGIDHCDVVYEAPVEGGITRLMGISED